MTVEDFFTTWGRINGCDSQTPPPLSTPLSSPTTLSSPPPSNPNSLLAEAQSLKQIGKNLNKVMCKSLVGCRAATSLCIHIGKQHGDVMMPGRDSATQSIARFFFD